MAPIFGSENARPAKVERHKDDGMDNFDMDIEPDDIEVSDTVTVLGDRLSPVPADSTNPKFTQSMICGCVLSLRRSHFFSVRVSDALPHNDIVHGNPQNVCENDEIVNGWNVVSMLPFIDRLQ